MGVNVSPHNPLQSTSAPSKSNSFGNFSGQGAVRPLGAASGFGDGGGGDAAIPHAILAKKQAVSSSRTLRMVDEAF